MACGVWATRPSRRLGWRIRPSPSTPSRGGNVPRLVAFAWTLTGSLPAAEELAQEALAAAWGRGIGSAGSTSRAPGPARSSPTGPRRGVVAPAARPALGRMGSRRVTYQVEMPRGDGRRGGYRRRARSPCRNAAPGPARRDRRAEAVWPVNSPRRAVGGRVPRRRRRERGRRWELVAGDDVEQLTITLRDESGASSVGTSEGGLDDDYAYVSTSTGHSGRTPAGSGWPDLASPRWWCSARGAAHPPRPRSDPGLGVSGRRERLTNSQRSWPRAVRLGMIRTYVGVWGGPWRAS
jgi:hypothetical protein